MIMYNFDKRINLPEHTRAAVFPIKQSFYTPPPKKSTPIFLFIDVAGKYHYIYIFQLPKKKQRINLLECK